jgi:hypothetical protein
LPFFISGAVRAEIDKRLCEVAEGQRIGDTGRNDPTVMRDLRNLDRCGYRRASATGRIGRGDSGLPRRFAGVASGLVNLVCRIYAGHFSIRSSTFPKSRQSAAVGKSDFASAGRFFDTWFGLAR